MDEEQPKRRTAAPWIKWTIGLTNKIEVVRMANQLRRSRYEVAAMCMVTWEWADANVGEDGNALGVTKSFLDEHIGVTGFADAMEAAGWLRADDQGLIFPNYQIHNGGNAKTRAQTQKRVAKHRV